MTTAYISHPDFMKHEMGRHHPECPERIQAIEDQLIQALPRRRYRLPQ